MKTWAGARDYITRRSAAEISNEISAVSLAYNFPSYVSGTHGTVGAYLSELANHGQMVIEFPGKRASFAADAMSAFSKFYHVMGCSRLLMSSGAMTWSISDGYHTSMLGGRAVLASFGVLPYSFPGRTVLVDFFPEYGSKDQRNAFKKATKDITEPVRLLAPISSPLLEQKELWRVVERIGNVAELDADEQGLFLQIVDLLKERPWTTRNQSLYDSVAWIWPSDIAMPSVPAPQQTTMLSTSGADIFAFSSFLDTIFDLVEHYQAQLNASQRFGALMTPPNVIGCTSPFVLV